MSKIGSRLPGRYVVDAVLVAAIAVSLFALFNYSDSFDGDAFDFLGQRSGFEISDQTVDFHTPDKSFMSALAAGIVNTVKAGIAGAVLATLFGVLLVFAMSSRNVLASASARILTEVIGRTSWVIQILFWYF